jgi:hypothetical protein
MGEELLIDPCVRLALPYFRCRNRKGEKLAVDGFLVDVGGEDPPPPNTK